MRRLLPSTLALVLAACGGLPEGSAPCVKTKQDALRVCSGSTTVEGLDVSYYQGTITWSSVKSAGKKFAITRVSDGSNTLDTKFSTNWKAIKAQGMVRGVYQFFRPGQNPTTQANLLLSQVSAAGGFAANDMPPVIDVEVTDGVSNTTLRANMQTWLNVIEAATGKKPIIYTANFMSTAIGNGFTAYPLWVANYGATCPLMPSNWSAWKFWQYSSTGSVSGISGNVDLDQWNGTMAQLTSYVNPPAPDAGHPDAGQPDAGHPDAGTPDAGHPDSGVPDAGMPDAGQPDAGFDAGTPEEDAGFDAGTPEDDAGFDAGTPEDDAGVDSGEPDSGEPMMAMDSGVPGDQGLAMGDGRYFVDDRCK